MNWIEEVKSACFINHLSIVSWLFSFYHLWCVNQCETNFVLSKVCPANDSLVYALSPVTLCYHMRTKATKYKKVVLSCEQDKSSVITKLSCYAHIIQWEINFGWAEDLTNLSFFGSLRYMLRNCPRHVTHSIRFTNKI